MLLPVACRLVSLVLAVGATVAVAAAPQLPNGVAAGDTTSSSTVLWARANVAGPLRFEVSRLPFFVLPEVVGTVEVVEAMVPAKLAVQDLVAGTTYFYRAIDASGQSVQGRFRTADPPGVPTSRGLRFGVSGDWHGELGPYPAVRNVPWRGLDFFVELGDTIYADVASPAVPGSIATTLEQFRLKHDEVYSTRFGLNTLADLRRTASIFATIDDHEVLNDFSGGAPPDSDTRFDQTGEFINETELFSNALQSFHEYNPIESRTWDTPGMPRTDGKRDLYRSQVYGTTATVFVVDARSFRDAALPDVANPLDPAEVAAFVSRSFDIDPVTGESLPRRTMLGAPQLERLKSELLASESAGITWKVVCIPEPIQNLGFLAASDRFEGYAAERTELLRFIDDNAIRNVVFVAADVHGTLVNNLTYRLGPGMPRIDTTAFEITVGSVAAPPPFGGRVLGSAAGIPFGAGTLLDIFLATLGLDGLEQFEALPVGIKDLAVELFVSAQLLLFGLDPIGLEGSAITATLERGRYAAIHTFGWTELEIDGATHELVVTTYGIAPYVEADVGSDLAGRWPARVSRFRVSPK